MVHEMCEINIDKKKIVCQQIFKKYKISLCYIFIILFYNFYNFLYILKFSNVY